MISSNNFSATIHYIPPLTTLSAANQQPLYIIIYRDNTISIELILFINCITSIYYTVGTIRYSVMAQRSCSGRESTVYEAFT